LEAEQAVHMVVERVRPKEGAAESRVCDHGRGQIDDIGCAAKVRTQYLNRNAATPTNGAPNGKQLNEQ